MEFTSPIFSAKLVVMLIIAKLILILGTFILNKFISFGLVIKDIVYFISFLLLCEVAVGKE